MSDDKKYPQITSADDATKTSNKGNAELSEEELKRVSGGAIYMNWDRISGAVTTQGHESWIELNSFQK